MFRKTWSLEHSCNGTSLLEIRTMQSNFSFAFPFCIFQPLILRSGFIRSTGRAPHGFPFLRKQWYQWYHYTAMIYYDITKTWKLLKTKNIWKANVSLAAYVVHQLWTYRTSTLPSTQIWHQRSQLQIHRLLQTCCFSGHEGRLQTVNAICKGNKPWETTRSRRCQTVRKRASASDCDRRWTKSFASKNTECWWMLECLASAEKTSWPTCSLLLAPCCTMLCQRRCNGTQAPLNLRNQGETCSWKLFNAQWLC